MHPEVTWSATSTSGKRKTTNDDAWLVFSANAQKATRLEEHGTHSISNSDVVLAVSDGMGGGNAGDLASRLLLTQLSQIIPKTIELAASGFNPDYLEQLENALHNIHSSINKHGENEQTLKGMAATITLAWITPENIYIGHVGDSRLYLHRQGETTQITEDHNTIWKKFNNGELSEIRYRMHPKRNILNEVMGGGHSKIRPQLLSYPYLKGDRFMLCSDGLVDGLTQIKIHKQLSHNSDSTKSTLSSLISASNDNDDTDDTTSIVFDIQ